MVIACLGKNCRKRYLCENYYGKLSRGGIPGTYLIDLSIENKDKRIFCSINNNFSCFVTRQDLIKKYIQSSYVKNIIKTLPCTKCERILNDIVLNDEIDITDKKYTSAILNQLCKFYLKEGN